MRSLALPLLLVGCSLLEGSDDAATIEAIAEVPTAEELGEAPAIDPRGWVRTEGPIALLDVAIRAEEPPSLDGLDADRICHSPHDRHREALLVEVPLGDGDRTIGVPTQRCTTLPYCRWAESRARAASEEARPRLLSSLRGCPGTVTDGLLEEASVEVRAQHRLERAIGAPSRLHPEELPQVVGELDGFEESRLAHLLVDAWERLDRADAREQLLRVHATTRDPAQKRRVGRALGVFADRRARAAWEESCVGVEGLLCSSARQLGPVDETSGHIVRNALQALPRAAARLYVGDVRATVGEDTTAELLVTVVGDEAATTWARGLALEELAALYPERLPEAMAVVRSDARLGLPHLARRARLAAVDEPAAHLASLGLVDGSRAITVDPGADPVGVMIHEGRGLDDQTVLGVPLLGALLVLLDIPDAEVSVDDDAGRLTVWVQGSRIDAYHDGISLDTDPENIRTAVGFANAVAEHVGVPSRALPQPSYGFADGNRAAIVVAPVEALQAGIDDGVLTPVVAEPSAWEPRRRLWWQPPEVDE